MSRDIPLEFVDGLHDTLHSIYNQEVVPLLDKIENLNKEIEWYRSKYNNIYMCMFDK